MNARYINDVIFFCFPIGWIIGNIAGCVYAGFNWNNLHVEFGRSVLIATTVSSLITLVLVHFTIKRIEARLPKRPVAWRVKDYGDGWILCQDEKVADCEAKDGALVQGLYVRDGT